MQKNYAVAEIDIDEDTGDIINVSEVIHKERLPYSSIQKDEYGEITGVNIHRLNHWWQKRGVPENRDGIKTLLPSFGVTNLHQLQLLNDGLSLADCYWIKRTYSNASWDKMNFFTNDFTYEVGDLFFENKPLRENGSLYSPDLSTGGWLRKTWKIKNNKRYLIKAGSEPNNEEPINEVLASKLLESLNFIPFVKYRLGNISKTAVSVCKNFLNENTEFIPADFIYKSKPRNPKTSVYDHLIERCNEYGIPGMSDFIDRMLQVDYILANQDRHLSNFGFLRDVDTLKILGPAPLFDNGTSLWNNQSNAKLLSALNVSKPFKNMHKEQILLINKFQLSPEELANVPELYDDVMRAKTKMDLERIKMIRKKLCENIDSFNRFVEKLPEEMKDFDNIHNIEALKHEDTCIKEQSYSCDSIDDVIAMSTNEVNSANILRKKVSGSSMDRNELEVSDEFEYR